MLDSHRAGLRVLRIFFSSDFVGLTFAACAIFDEIIEAWNSGSHVQFADLCAPWKFVSREACLSGPGVSMHGCLRHYQATEQTLP